MSSPEQALLILKIINIFLNSSIFCIQFKKVKLKFNICKYIMFRCPLLVKSNHINHIYRDITYIHISYLWAICEPQKYIQIYYSTHIHLHLRMHVFIIVIISNCMCIICLLKSCPLNRWRDYTMRNLHWI